MAFPPRRSDPIPIDFPAPERLNSWKEIAARLRTSVRTAQRWEQTESLPVHRHRHVNDSTVYAYTHELDRWLSSRRIQPAGSAEPDSHRRRFVLLTFSSLIVMASAAAILAVSSSPVPPRPALRPFATADPAQMYPAWSPDGASIAFLSERSGRRRVMLQRTSSTTPVALTPHDPGIAPRQYLFWSPDSHWVYFFRAGGLWRVPAGGGEATLVQDRADAGSLSPDGRVLVTFGVSPEREWRIYVASPPEAPREPYEPQPFAATSNLQWPNVTFAPDGKKILAAVNLPGRGPEYWMLPWPPAKPVKVLQNLEKFGRLVFLAWLPDSRHIVFLVRRSRNLFVADTAAARHWPAETLDRWPEYPSVSNDGTRVAHQVRLSHTDIISVPLGDGEVQPLLDSSAFEEMGSVHSSSGRLVYIADRRGYFDLWMRSGDAAATSVVIAEKVSLTSAAPVLSPDGSTIAYRTALNPATSGIVTMPSSGGERRVQFSDPVLFAPSWSPDGKWLTFLRSGRLVRLRVDSGEPPIDLASSRPSSTHPHILPEWSPSGQWIAFADETNNLALISPDGHTRRVIGGCGPVAWSRDGKKLYQVNYDAQSILEIDVANGTRRTVRHVGELLPYASTEPARRVSLTPDGRSLVYTVLRPREEIWILDGLKPPRQWYARLLPGH